MGLWDHLWSWFYLSGMDEDVYEKEFTVELNPTESIDRIEVRGLDADERVESESWWSEVTARLRSRLELLRNLYKLDF